MKRVTHFIALAILATFSLSPLGAAEEVWTGEISDSACGARHESGTENVPPPPAKECVENCVKGGSKYVLVLSDGRVLQIANQDAPGLASLAGTPVKVTGELKNNTVTIAKVEKSR
ncbi:MAG: hypothetical protein DMF90_27360 [Acidobacteria bacterium]|nr:MAG: hypothetical protein DMF90_27360 [Acidobacteriota bacterium]